MKIALFAKYPREEKISKIISWGLGSPAKLSIGKYSEFTKSLEIEAEPGDIIVHSIMKRISFFVVLNSGELENIDIYQAWAHFSNKSKEPTTEIKSIKKRKFNL